MGSLKKGTKGTPKFSPFLHDSEHDLISIFGSGTKCQKLRPPPTPKVEKFQIVPFEKKHDSENCTPKYIAIGF